MATVIRNVDPALAGIVTAHNALVVQIGAGAFFHMDKYEVSVISSANSSSLATALTLCNELINFGRNHLADSVAAGGCAHKVADTTSWPAIGAAVDLTSAQTAANLMKATWNTHIASTTYHYNADATNAIAAANASNQGTLDTLLNEMKVDMLAHTQSGASAASSMRLVSA